MSDSVRRGTPTFEGAEVGVPVGDIAWNFLELYIRA
jgi:hypothetical protein